MTEKFKLGHELTFDEYLERYYTAGFAEKAKKSTSLLDYLRSWYELDLLRWKNASETEIDKFCRSTANLKDRLSKNDFLALLEGVPNIYAKMGIKKDIEKRFG